MKNKLPQIWLDNLEKLDVAFQPILNIHTGRIFGVEALLRNFQDVGFQSIFELFDKVYEENLLYSFDIALREKALLKFSKIKNFENIKLFYNLDNRLLDMPNFGHGNTTKIINRLDIKKENIVFEISERHEISSECNIENIIKHYKNENFSIAIDDFGVGYSGYKLLYDFSPDIIKIDRFFLQDIEKNPKKKMLVRNITHLALELGIKVIAEGVETKAELITCRDIGCHMIQGYLIQKPTKNIDEIQDQYINIKQIIKEDRRIKTTRSKTERHLNKIEPLYIDTKMKNIISYFKTNGDIPYVPVLNSNHEPLGVLHESKIRGFLYSPYGMSLLSNDDSSKSKLKHHISYCGNSDVNSGISTIIEIFSNNPDSIGIIITKNSKYHGFLSAKDIITIMYEENLLLARDQNPLTKLPGNRMIESYMATSIEKNSTFLLCYFDLDNFKAFNDVYGFRSGDRVIQLFADILRKDLSTKFFKAHIGGDDFFTAVEVDETNKEQCIEEIKNVVKKFSKSAKELYSKEDRKNGYISSQDRDGNKKKFELLSVSASVLILKDNSKYRNLDNVNDILSMQKKVAKNEFQHISISCLL